MPEEKNPPRAQIFRYFRIESRNNNLHRAHKIKSVLPKWKLSNFLKRFRVNYDIRGSIAIIGYDELCCRKKLDFVFSSPPACYVNRRKEFSVKEMTVCYLVYRSSLLSNKFISRFSFQISSF